MSLIPESKTPADDVAKDSNIEASSSFDSDAKKLNEDLSVLKEELKNKYAEASILSKNQASESEYNDLFLEIKALKKKIKSLQEEFRKISINELSKSEDYAFWDQGEATISQLIMEYGSMDYLYVFAPLLFLAYGTGVIRPVLMSKLTNSVKKNETATLLGVNNSLTSIVHVITPIAGGFIIQYLPSQIVPILSVMFLFVLLFYHSMY